jgi:hypothetical protein
MKTGKQLIRGAFGQGDVAFFRIDAIPATATLVERKGNEPVIVTHSETGHHHVIEAPKVKMFNDPKNPLLSFLQVETDNAVLEHLRSHDTHEAVQIPAGCWAVRRQREYTPEGWRQVQD